MKYCYLHGHLHHHHFKQFEIISLHLPIVTSNYGLYYYARECSIIPELKLQPIILKIMLAY